MTIKLVDLWAHHEELMPSIQSAIDEMVRSSAFIGGTRVSDFEAQFAKFCGVDHCVGVSSGTSALEVALSSLGIGPGDEVITQDNTFFATVEAILNVGATPVLVDCEASSGGMDVEALASVISPRTRVIIPVHLFGHLADMTAITRIAEPREILTVEDASQAHGAEENGRRAGSYGVAAGFSFFPGKNLGAWGDAGGITTQDSALESAMRKRRDHGRQSKYLHDAVGTNARLDPLQALILSAKLDRLPAWNARRAAIAQRYLTALVEAGIPAMQPREGSVSAWHLFVVRLANRDEVQDTLRARGIETGIHYPVPMHRQPALAHLTPRGSLAVSEQLADEMLSIPIHGCLSDDDVDKIVDSLLSTARPAEEQA